jgi:hypothetical protein
MPHWGAVASKTNKKAHDRASDDYRIMNCKGYATNRSLRNLKFPPGIPGSKRQNNARTSGRKPISGPNYKPEMLGDISVRYPVQTDSENYPAYYSVVFGAHDLGSKADRA